ncbi:MAG: hypothetical protein LBG58_05485 [Planctomycetaceae bacterium]|nr:hypothetical protein [Planctomycetaceae bacterium]
MLFEFSVFWKVRSRQCHVAVNFCGGEDATATDRSEDGMFFRNLPVAALKAAMKIAAEHAIPSNRRPQKRQ